MPKIKRPKSTLKELIKHNEAAKDELEQLLAKVQADERMMIEREQSQFQPKNFKDPHYQFYESLRPKISSIDKSYVYGVKGVVSEKDLAEHQDKLMTIPLKDIDVSIESFPELRNVLEGISDYITNPDSTSSMKAGVPLRKRQTEGELRLTQLIVNSRYNADPYCRGAVDTLGRYISGNGLRVSCQYPEIRAVIEDFTKQTKFLDNFTDFVKTSFKDGEVGFEIQCEVKKRIKQVRWSAFKIFSEEIRGREFNLENPGQKYTFLKQAVLVAPGEAYVKGKWIADINYFTQFNTRGTLVAFAGMQSGKHDNLSDNHVVAWFQHGDKREMYGRVPLEPVIRDFRLYEDFRINRAILNYERSKVLYIKTEKAQINRRTKDAASTTRKSAAPSGGVMLTLGPNESIEMKTASLQAQDADHDGMLFQYAAGTGLSMPIYILGVRADQQNYGAIKNTDSPFNQMILEYAGEFSSYSRNIFRYVIRKAIEAGILPKTMTISKVSEAAKKKELWWNTMQKAYKLLSEKKKITEEILDSIDTDIKASMESIEINTIDVPFDIILADAVKPNPLELAKTAFIQRKLGTVSSQTLSEEMGYDWSQELLRMLNEKALGIYDPGSSQQGSGNATGGLGDGGDVQTEDGTSAQNTK